ncbi:MAG: hypothetical protein WAW06_12195 [bacterium]
MRLEHLLIGLMFVLVTTGVEPGDPGQWSLSQNEPDPFCPAPGNWGTDFRFGLRQSCQAALTVWDPGMVSIVGQVLPASWCQAGLYRIRWDGLDDAGSPLPNGAYPYTLVAMDSLGVALFADTLVCHLLCPVGTEPTTWGAIKARHVD